jgi:hypothetical protein
MFSSARGVSLKIAAPIPTLLYFRRTALACACVKTDFDGHTTQLNFSAAVENQFWQNRCLKKHFPQLMKISFGKIDVLKNTSHARRHTPNPDVQESKGVGSSETDFTFLCVAGF